MEKIGVAIEEFSHEGIRLASSPSENWIVEGWLPAGTSQNSLDDGDFAWLSQAYKSGKETNKSVGRKLPFKIHGKVNRDGWKAAWKAASHPGARHPDFSGGPGQAEVLAILRRYKPRGITIDKENSFTDTAGEEGLPFLSAMSKSMVVLEETNDGLRFKGVALIDEAVSCHDRYYSAAFNDRCMEATNTYMAGGGIVTIYSRHGKAIGSPLGGLPTDLPVGRVMAPLFREGNEIWYTGFIAPTTEGKDVAVLIRNQVITATSIRALEYESRMRKLNGRPVEEMVSAVLAGIDLADAAGISGAGIREVLEEAPNLTETEEEEQMDMKELTAAQLLAERPDLVAELTASALEPVSAQLEDIKPKLAKLEASETAWTGDKTALVKKLSDLETTLTNAQLRLKIAEAAHIGQLSRTIYESLQVTVKSEADIPGALRDARDKALIEFTAGIQSGDSRKTAEIKGVQNVVEAANSTQTEKDDQEPPLTEEFEKILNLAA